MISENRKLTAELCDASAPQMTGVVIGGNKITAIVPCGTPVEGEHERVDIHGATLLLGLIDAHIHLLMDKATTGDKDRITVPAQWALDCYNYARFFLDSGYTTIRDVDDELHYNRLTTRNTINKGTMQGPRIYGSGMAIVPVTAGFDACKYFYGLYNTKEDVRWMVRDRSNHGADSLRLYRTGSMLMDDSLPGKRIMLEDEVAETVTMIKNRGSYCTRHCHGAEAIDAMIEQGVRIIEHASFITDESCKKLDRRKDMGVVPTIACSCPEALGTTEDTGAAHEKFSRVGTEQDVCIRNAYENYNILMGWGTGMDLNSTQANSYMEWQTRKNRLDISNLGLLEQVTTNSVVLTGVDNKIGTVSTEKLVDLIIVGRGPIAGITTIYKELVHAIKDDEVIR